MGKFKIQVLKWLISWADLASGILGVLTLGFVTLDLLQLRCQCFFLDNTERESLWLNQLKLPK